MRTLKDKRKLVESIYKSSFYNSYIHPDKLLVIKQVLKIIKEQDKEFIEEVKAGIFNNMMTETEMLEVMNILIGEESI